MLVKIPKYMIMKNVFQIVLCFTVNGIKCYESIGCDDNLKQMHITTQDSGYACFAAFETS